jgi:two-component system, LuxR family, sensor kinase FixL
MTLSAKYRNLLAFFFESPKPVRSFTAAWVAIAGIAFADWIVAPNVSIGILYVFPMLLAAPVLRQGQIVLLAALCSVLRESFSPFAGSPGMAIRLIAVFCCFSGVGWLVSELYQSRRLVVQHVREREAEMALRLSLECELAAVVEASPLAILLTDDAGCIRQANSSATRLLAPQSGNLVGQRMQDYLPLPIGSNAVGELQLRTRMECRARRGDGAPLLGYVWLASYGDKKTAVVVWDGTDDLRDREGAGFDSLMTTSRILLGGISHELRNFVSAARDSHSRLAAAAAVEHLPEYRTLGRALDHLENAAASGLRLAADRCTTIADLSLVLDETRIIKEPGLEDAGVEVQWPESGTLPRVRGDQQALVQVFVNLLRNSRLALSDGQGRAIHVSAVTKQGRVLVSVKDTGPGISHPEHLFEVFQPSARTGLGLYLSRCILLSFGGDLRYERTPSGASFVVELQTADRCA